MSLAQAQRKHLLDEEYYTPPVEAQPERHAEQPPPPPMEQQPPPPPPQPPAVERTAVRAEEYIASTAHLLEAEQVPTAVRHGIDWYLRAGERWVRVTAREGSIVTERASPEEVSRVLREGEHYYISPGLAEKVAEHAAPQLWAYGLEDAVRVAKLKEVFPELRGEVWVGEVDVYRAVSRRLEEMGVQFDYERWLEASRAVLRAPEVWNYIVEDIERQRRERELLSRYERQLERGLLPEEVWRVPSREELERHYEKQYAALVEHRTENVFLHALGATFARSFFVPAPVQGYEALAARREELAARVPAPGMVLPRARIEAGRQQGVYSEGELAELKAIEKHAAPEKELALIAGTAAGTLLSWLAWGKALELAGKAVSRLLPAAAKAKVERVAERVGLFERRQLVPGEVRVDVQRLTAVDVEAGERLAARRFLTRVESWVPAEEALGTKVPEQMRLRPGEVSWLPLEGGLRAPVVGEGRAITAVRTGEGRYVVEAWGMFRESEVKLLALEKLREGAKVAVEPRLDIGSYGGRVSYAKLLEYARGGLPAVALQQREGLALATSPTPRVPVREIAAVGPAATVLPAVPAALPHLTPRRREEYTPPGLRLPEPRLPFAEVRERRALPPVVPPVAPQPPVSTASLAPPRSAELPSPLPPLQVPRVAPSLEQLPRVAPRVEGVERLAPLEEPRVVPPAPIPAPPPVPPRVVPEPPRLLPEPRLPPPPPLLSSGRRDLPSLERLLRRVQREWRVEWFGRPPLDPLSPRRKRGRRG